MIRELILDTETTGLNPLEGHRVIEIAAIEIIDYLPTGKTYQQYINPQRDVPETSFKVHGLSYEFLKCIQDMYHQMELPDTSGLYLMDLILSQLFPLHLQ